jgi:hypothetical protein
MFDIYSNLCLFLKTVALHFFFSIFENNYSELKNDIKVLQMEMKYIQENIQKLENDCIK